MNIHKAEHIKTDKFLMYKCEEVILYVYDGYIDSSGELLDAQAIHITSLGDVIKFVY